MPLFTNVNWDSATIVTLSTSNSSNASSLHSEVSAMPTTTETPVITYPSRAFGVEIEVLGSRLTILQGFAAAGIVCEDRYSHVSSGPNWRLVSDGSITGGESCEVVSPILQGAQGFQTLKKVCEILGDAGCRVNRSCGFHVHVDARDLLVEEAIHVSTRYGRWEDYIDWFVPQSRRNCYHARSVKGVTYTNKSTRADFAGEGRYHKVNLQALSKHGTVEFRQHSGTTNYDKMENWIRFCLEFTEASRRLPADTSASPAGTPSPTRRRKPMAEQLLLLARALEDHTRSVYVQDICQQLGIAPQSLPKYVRKLNERVTGRASLITPVYLSRTRGYSHVSQNHYQSDDQAIWQEKISQLEEEVRNLQSQANYPQRYVWGPTLVGKLRKVAESLVSNNVAVYVGTHTIASHAGISAGSVPGYVQRLRDLLGVTIKFRHGTYRIRWTSEIDKVRTFAQGQECPEWLQERLQACSTLTRRPRAPQLRAGEEVRFISEDNDFWRRGISVDVQNWLRERASDLNPTPNPPNLAL